MTRRITGGCQCGAVRYRASGEPRGPHVCHCRMCQKAAGNYFLPLGSFARADFTMTRGMPKWFASSDLVRRGFCEVCGTPLFYDIPETDFITVALGSLDDSDAVRPAMQSTASARLAGRMYSKAADFTYFACHANGNLAAQKRHLTPRMS